MLTLGTDELIAVCCFLDWKDVVLLSLTCKTLQLEILSCPCVWRNAFKASVPTSFGMPSQLSPSDWRSHFVNWNKAILNNSNKVFSRLFHHPSFVLFQCQARNNLVTNRVWFYRYSEKAFSVRFKVLLEGINNVSCVYLYIMSGGKSFWAGACLTPRLSFHYTKLPRLRSVRY